MRFPTTFGLAALACASLASADVLKPRNYDTHDYFSLHLRSGESPAKVARALGVDYEGQIGELQNHHYFSVKRGDHGVEEILDDVKRRIKKRELRPEGLDGILWHQKQKLKPRMHKRSPLPSPPIIPGTEDDTAAGHDAMAIKQRQQVALKLDIADPIFGEQWHLFNTLELGNDINVTGVWLDGNTGKGSIVAVLDDGLDMYSDDLKANYFAEGSYDFNDHVAEPKPKLDDDKHGTRCAGEVSAVKNNVCGVGIAYDSKIAGIRILGGTISDEDEAASINYKMDQNQIYSCSWGPPDDGMSMDAPDALIKGAMLNGVQKGREGLGSIFVFAAGNGAASEDNCNFDGYTNSIYSVTVGAIDRKGVHPYYSEKCSASLVVTYSSGAGDAIHTTDVGTNECYAGHGGTSAAAPIAVGIFALVLSVRPDLNWRDIQYLCVETAVPINLEDGEWQDTYIGKKYSHTYAYGKLDAYTMVEKAKTWKSVNPQAWYKSPWQHVKHAIPQGEKGLASSFEVTDKMLKDANLRRIEQITVTMNVEHTRRGDLSVELLSPHGVKSHLSATRRNDKLAEGYVDWTFMSVVHWGEPGVGKWTVIVKDTVDNEFTGNFTDWRLALWGESIDPKKATLHPMPTEHDDDDHDKEPEDNSHTEPAAVETTTVALESTTSLPSTPTDHPNRPVNVKPGKSSSSPASSLATSTVATSSVATSSVAPTAEADTAASATESAIVSSTATPTPEAGYHLPSIFPTFGVSPTTQVWIYGSFGLILIFCASLGGYILYQKRQKQGPAYDTLETYEDQEGAGAGKQRRAGELYDAFAGESDEDEGLFSESEKESLDESRSSGSYGGGAEKPYRDEERARLTG